MKPKHLHNTKAGASLRRSLTLTSVLQELLAVVPQCQGRAGTSACKLCKQMSKPSDRLLRAIMNNNNQQKNTLESKQAYELVKYFSAKHLHCRH